MSTLTIAKSMAAPPHRPASPVPLTPILSLEHTLQNTSTTCPLPIPNKHLPVCPTGPSTLANQPDTPPASPPSKHDILPSYSLLYPPDEYTKINSRKGDIYCLDANEVANAINHIATQPLPEATQVFPWLHGLHAENQVQQSFFVARRKALRKTPTCLRGITIVKADGDLSRCRLKGAIAPDEVLRLSHPPTFKDVDPKEGFSVRNFQVQTGKMATLSDVIVYGEDEVETRTMAWKFASAQQAWRDTHYDVPTYNTFICTTPFQDFENDHPDIVVATSKGDMTGNVVDFFYQERKEMSEMTAASEIAPNIWLGPTPDVHEGLDNPDGFDVYVECGDTARLDPSVFQNAVSSTSGDPHYLELPSSGSIPPQSWDSPDAIAILGSILEAIQWIHTLATGSPHIKSDDEGDTKMTEVDSSKPHKVLFHCTDGYTETSLMALAYFIYATGKTVAEAWLALHCEKKRNFFAYPTDVTLLNALAPRLLAASPALHHPTNSPTAISERLCNQPRWLSLVDGSFPSRITDYMYLGNLTHANNPKLLKELNIGQLLSVGEEANWEPADIDGWSENDVMRIQNVQDNGIDELWCEFERCLEFIAQGHRTGKATLVHCRVGVSRSATICIAEIMRARNLSFPRAYCFVRARRLNVIIQPHLRFSYELLKWEEELGRRRCAGRGGIGSDDKLDGELVVKRELEWEQIAREIACMNRPYSR